MLRRKVYDDTWSKGTEKIRVEVYKEYDHYAIFVNGERKASVQNYEEMKKEISLIRGEN